MSYTICSINVFILFHASSLPGVAGFNTFTKGQEVIAGQGLDAATASAISGALGMSSSSGRGWGASGGESSWAWSTAPKPSLKAWNSALPPTGITMSASTLQMLRSSVRSTIKSKPVFETMHRTLNTSEVDLKKTMGEPMDISQASVIGRK